MRKKIAFIKFAGLAAGGTESFIQTVAANLPKDKYEVYYFYTNPAPYIGSNWVHPDNDPFRKQYLEKNGVKLIECKVAFKDVTNPIHPWIDTDFWEKYKEHGPFDLIQTGRAGHPEYPFTNIQDVPIVEAVTLAGMSDNQPNIVASLHCSKWSADQWIKSGGDPKRVHIIPLIKEMPDLSTIGNLREYLGISPNDIVFGFHQRNDPNIFSEIPLLAYKQVETEGILNTWFIQMGGSDKYSKQARELKLKRFIQINHSGDEKLIFRFLKTLDMFTHGRSDGETYGVAIAEALYCSLPIVSHVAPCMGHAETIGNAGKICNNVQEYTEEMKSFIHRSLNREYYGYMDKICAFEQYNKYASVEANMQKIMRIYDEILSRKNTKVS